MHSDAYSDETAFRVLVVEDELILAMQLEDLLSELGHAVLGPAPTVERALDLLAQEQPDVALLDVNLRGKRVTPVAEVLQARAVPFVLITGYSEHQLSEAVLCEAPRLDKPVDSGELSRLLAMLAKQPGQLPYTRSQ